MDYHNAFIKQGNKSARAITIAKILFLAQKKEKDVMESEQTYLKNLKI